MIRREVSEDDIQVEAAASDPGATDMGDGATETGASASGVVATETVASASEVLATETVASTSEVMATETVASGSEVVMGTGSEPRPAPRISPMSVSDMQAHQLFCYAGLGPDAVVGHVEGAGSEPVAVEAQASAGSSGSELVAVETLASAGSSGSERLAVETRASAGSSGSELVAKAMDKSSQAKVAFSSNRGVARPLISLEAKLALSRAKLKAQLLKLCRDMVCSRRALLIDVIRFLCACSVFALKICSVQILGWVAKVRLALYSRKRSMAMQTPAKLAGYLALQVGACHRFSLLMVFLSFVFAVIIVYRASKVQLFLKSSIRMTMAPLPHVFLPLWTSKTPLCSCPYGRARHPYV